MMRTSAAGETDGVEDECRLINGALLKPDHLAKLAAGDTALAGSNETVTSVARSEYVRIVGDDARNMTTDAAHDSANYSDSATTSTFQRPVAAHALGVG